MHSPHTVPSWVAGYIGIPFADRGRERRDGLDCWGLVRLVYAERFGVILPSYADKYSSAEHRGEVSAIAERTINEHARWTRAGGTDLCADQVGDVLLYRIGGWLQHVGVYVGDGRMLHVMRGIQSCTERTGSIPWRSRLGGVYRYAGPVLLAGRPVPLKPDRVDVELPAGMTVTEMIAAAGIEPNPCLIVHVGGHRVPREMWAHVRPKPGRQITVAAIPTGGNGEGGGKTALRVVASIVVIVAAAYTGGVAGTFYGAVWGAAASAAVGIAGSLAIAALIPPPKPRLSAAGGQDDSDSLSPTIASAQNELRPNAPVPIPFGDYRWAPPYGSKPYVELVGDDQYLRCLFIIGEGPVAILDPRIGATDLENYEGVEIEVREGWPDDAPMSLFPAAVQTEDFSIALTQAGDWVERTSSADAQELSVEITLPTGLAQFAADGTKQQRTVELEIEYRLTGDDPANWRKINGSGLPGGSPSGFREMDVLFRTPEAVLGGSGTHANDLNWSADQVPYPDAKPAYLPVKGYAWMAFGYIYAPDSGQYTFCVDSADAADVHVDGREVAAWYGSHATEVTQATLDSTTHAGTPITLRRGWHSFRARVECRSLPGGALAVGWKKPGDAVFTIVPQANFGAEPAIDIGLQDKLKYRWYKTDAYGSDLKITEQRTDPIRRAVTWAVPDPSPTTTWDVRVRRITADSASSLIFDTTFWTNMRTITTKSPLPKPGLAAVAMRIKATDQLNGPIEQFNVRTRSILPDFDGSTGAWILRATSNPASCLRSIYEGPASAPLLPEARIDLAELARFHTDCITRGLSFNGVIDFKGTVIERAADVAAAGRATPGMRDGLFSVVRDTAQTVPVQHFTPANSRGFAGERVFTDLPHAFRVQYLNAAVGYQQDERVVPDDGYTYLGRDAFGTLRPDLPEASVFETLEVFGCTSADEAFRHGRYHLAVAKLRPELYTLETDVEHLVCTRGDLVMVTHDVPLWGQAFGRVTGRVTDTAGNLTAIRTDNQITMDVGGLYRVRVRLADGSSFLRDVVTEPGDTHELTFASFVPASAPQPAVGDMFMFGPPGLESRELVVRSIEIDRDLGAKLTLVDHAPAVHLADQGVIPPYDSGITEPPRWENGPEDPVITAIRSDDLVMIRDADGSLRNRMLISLKPPTGTRPKPTHIQVRTRPKPPADESGAPWTRHPLSPIEANSISVTDVEQGVTYQIMLRAVSATGLTSRWVSAEHTIVGKSFPPPDVQSFDVSRLSDGTRRYTWVLGVVPPDVAGVKIRYGRPGSEWDAMAELHSDVLQSTPADLNAPTAGTWRFAVRAVDTSGNLSVNPLYLDRTLGQERLEGVAFSDDAGLAGWPGGKSNCHVVNQTLPPSYLEPNDTVQWDTLASHGAGTWATYTRWILSPVTPIGYIHTALDAGFEFDFSPDAITDGDGSLLVEVAWSSDDVTYSAWTEVSVAKQTSVRARYLKARVTASVTATAPVPTIHRMLVLMRAKTTVLELQDVQTSSLPPAAIVGVGDVRLPINPGQFTVIRNVSLTFNGMGPGWSWELVDKDTAQGPRVKMYNAAGTLSHALVDATIRGL